MVRKEISKYKVDKPLEIFEHEIVAFSYFFDRAVDAGIIGMSTTDFSHLHFAYIN